MINPINNKRYKTIQNYSTLNKKPTPISIVTAENTIFIKTNHNKLTSNYIKNGNQIRHNKNYLSTTINQSQKINNSLKNNISLEKSNLTKNLEKKNLKDINNRINELLKFNKLRKNHYRGANSFIKIEKKGLNNLSGINTINGLNKNNHIFNFYNLTSKLNNSSVKGKPKIKNESENFNVQENDKNNINSTYTISIDASSLKHKNKEMSKSISKKTNSNLDKAKFYKKLNYSNNLSILINSSNHDNFYFRNINSYLNKEREKTVSRINKQHYYSKRINNKYIYSIEKKKEKSLVKKREKAKKPISYLAKNNYLNQLNNKKNIVKISLNLNKGINEGETINSNKSSKRKNIGHKIINYKKNIYNIENYNYNINVEKEENNKNKIKIIEFNNDNINKASPSGDNSIKNNRENLKKNILNENNNIINNNYYNINNTFIFDNFGNRLNQYDLTKLITKNNNSLNIDYIDMNNYNSNIFKTIDTDIERSKTNIIKNITRKIKKDSSNNLNINNKIKKKKNDNTNNKLNIKKLSNIELNKLLKEKTGKNYLQFLTVNNKISVSNINQKGIKTKSNNISMNQNNQSKNITKKKIKIRLEPKIAEDANNNQRNLNIRNNLDLNNKNIITKNNNPNSIYRNIITKEKDNNSKNKEINNNDIMINSIKNFTINSTKNRKIIAKNEKKEKKDSNTNTNNIQESKIISNKLLKNQTKNKSYNLDKIYRKENELINQQKYNNYVNNIIELQPKQGKENENINNIIFSEYENNDNEENYSLKTDRGQKEWKQNSSFELVSLSDNNINDNDLSKNEDNFDDINSIIKKINFNVEEDDNDIFSQNNKKYKEFDKKFDKRFNKWIKNSNNL